jgi:N-methylhydantoinase B
MATLSALDPITFEVIRNALVEVTEEMSVALRRSAYSTNIKTRADFSCALFDRDVQTVSQAFAQANHLGSLTKMVPRIVQEYGAANLAPGDALLSNDPYRGGAHLNDVLLVTPVYHEGEIVAYVANLAHHVDVGGGAPASVGAFREVYQEGVIIPPVKLVAGGELVPDTFNLVLSQVRAKHETAGDFRAQIAANATGRRRLAGLIERYGAAEIAAYIAELLAYTDRRTRAELERLPRGMFTAEGYLDSDGYTDDPVRLVATVSIDEDGVTFDLTGSDPQRRAPVNSTSSQTFSACAYVLKCLIDPDIPVNAGFYRHVRVIAPAGTVVNANHPAPVVGGWEINSRLTDVLLRALAPGLPDRVPAGTKAMICHAGFGGVDPATGNYDCFLETLAGGYGGRRGSDGPDAVQTHGQNTENAPVEETERNYPVRITRYELVDDSEGAGQWRGGLGLRRDYLFPDRALSFTVLADRERWGPPGLFGGQDGQPATYIRNPEGEATPLGSKATVELEPGDTVSYRTCGGGGYGPPHERDPELVLRDVREAKVSLARARDVYRVAVDPERWAVDEVETARLRHGKGGQA